MVYNRRMIENTPTLIQQIVMWGSFLSALGFATWGLMETVKPMLREVVLSGMGEDGRNIFVMLLLLLRVFFASLLLIMIGGFTIVYPHAPFLAEVDGFAILVVSAFIIVGTSEVFHRLVKRVDG